ncbi:MAG: VWA domain-containing protein [Chthoniobacterales bacterium]
MTAPTFANLAGLWALLAIPAILAIHFLQRRSRRAVVSTRFLLDSLTPVSATGRRFEHLRNSANLWLQLLAVLLVTWLLLQPRWLRPDSHQTIVLVVDSSLSMAAFRSEIDNAISTVLPDLADTAASTEWIAIESNPDSPPVYSGRSLAELRSAFDEWQPDLGSHDFAPALRLARSLARDPGTILFLSDRPSDLPPTVTQVNVGRPIPNVGWIGLQTDDETFTALIQNHGKSPVDTAWQIAGSPDPPTPVQLEPGEIRSIRGSFADSDRLTLTLPEDQFPVDNTLPIVRPLAKELRIRWPADSQLAEYFARISDSFENTRRTPEQADLTLATYSTLAPTPVAPSSITFVTDPAPPSSVAPGTITAENHPLVADLNWRSLLVRDSFTVPPREGDEPLLWIADRPLVFLRDQALVINFDIRHSNAERLPAFVILLNRYAESLRQQRLAFHRENFELSQPLAVDSDSRISPSRPAFFQIAPDDIPLLDGASHFADPREADFADAATSSTISETQTALLTRNTEQDLLTPVWLLLLGAVTIGTWVRRA